MTLQVPSLLMLIGAALLAVAIFAPKSPRAGAVSMHVPHAAAVDRWIPSFTADTEDQPFPGPRLADDAAPSWPERFDPRAARCDAAARIELIGALAGVRAGWGESVLRAAFDEETDPNVRRALEDVMAQRHAVASRFGDA